MADRKAEKRSRRQWVAMARQRIRKGEPGAVVQNHLVAEGLPLEQAEQIVADAINSIRSGAFKLLAIGGSVALLGILVTVASYSAATLSSYGGTYLIWWGPVVFGLVIFVVGLVRLVRIRR